MILVFITRKLDRADTRTGFVFDWVETLAGKLDKLYVICQEKGELGELPDNVEVHSFGKEKGYGRLRQGYELLVLSYQFGKKSEGIFCHMMPIYAVSAWLPAKLTGNKLVLWYTHKSVDLKLKLAAMLVDSILTASRESFRLQSPKVKVAGHGIPVSKFQSPIANRQSRKDIFKIISIGRISRVKDYESLIKAIEILVRDREVTDIHCDIYGDPAVKQDFSYLQSLLVFVKNAGLHDFVNFQGGVAYDKVPELYWQADLFVSMSQTGSVDKAVLEASASGIAVLSSNEADKESLSAVSTALVFERDNPELLAGRIEELMAMSQGKRQEIGSRLNKWVEREHDLARLADKIVEEFKPR